MTEQEFWIKVREHLDIPFDTENIVHIDSDPMGNIYIDLKDESTYALSFQEVTLDEEDDD